MTKGYAMRILNLYKRELSRQQYRTIRGQILSDNIDGAMKGLSRLVGKKVCA